MQTHSSKRKRTAGDNGSGPSAQTEAKAVAKKSEQPVPDLARMLPHDLCQQIILQNRPSSIMYVPVEKEERKGSTFQ